MSANSDTITAARSAMRTMLPALTLALAITSCSSHSSATTSATSSANGTSIPGTHQQTRTYTIGQAVSSLVVDGGAGNVTVTGGARATIEVTEHLYYSRQAPDTTRTVSGDTLTARYSCPIQVTCLVSYDVAVPRSLAVKATTRAGAIRIDDVTGTVTASAGAGNIHADGIASGSAAFTTLAGTINASFTAPPSSVTARSHAGSVTIQLPGGAAYHVTTQTYVGSAAVSVPRDDRSPRNVTASTDLGNVTVATS